MSDGNPLWHHVAHLVREWGEPLVGKSGISSVGAVVGATHPRAVSEARRLLPHSPMLLPGVGAQGGSLNEISEKGMNGDCGLLVNASRAVIFAGNDEDFAEKSAEVAAGYASEMKSCLKKMHPPGRMHRNPD